MSRTLPKPGQSCSAFSTASGVSIIAINSVCSFRTLQTVGLRDGGIAELWTASESRAVALRGIETAIAAVDSIDVLHIGASDLSTEMGIPGVRLTWSCGFLTC